MQPISSLLDRLTRRPHRPAQLQCPGDIRPWRCCRIATQQVLREFRRRPVVGDSHRYGGIGRIDQRGCCNIGAVPRAVGCNGHKVEMEPCLGLAMALTQRVDQFSDRARYQGIQDTVRGAGACQGSCRLIYAASGRISSAFKWAATTESRSGLRVTGPTGDQSRVLPDQRAGFRSRASRYSACRAARMA